MSDSQYRSPRRGGFYDESGRVAIAQSAKASPLDDFEDALIMDLNIDPATAQQILELLDDQLDAIARHRTRSMAADCLRRVGFAIEKASLYKSPCGRALCRVLRGDNGLSLEDEAAQIGCSKQALHQHVLKIKNAVSLDGVSIDERPPGRNQR